MEEDDDEYSDGITEDDLKKALKEVRGKKTILKMKHKEKRNLRARSKIKKLSDMEEHLESKGINFNKESLKQRVKSRRSIGDLESNADKKSKRVLDSDDEGMDVDVNTMNVDGERRGRKRQRSMSADSDDYMEVDQVSGRPTSTAKSNKGGARSMTPAQLKVRAQSKLRSMSKGRREGSVPQRHPTRMVPEESIRLAKKINKRFKHTVNVNEADRVVTTKKPKHLYAGKRGSGKNERR